MITNTGKDILSKYLIGQAPSYAAYISFGCGQQPKGISDTFSSGEIAEYQAKQEMDFEMFRAPIVSRGYINENGTNQIVFTAELPTEERYEITELGIFSAGSNPAAGANDSRTLFSFADTESWEYHTATESRTLPFYQQRLSQSELDENSGTYALPAGGDDSAINITDIAFTANSDNALFEDTTRISRHERSRFLNSTTLMRGDSSKISGNSAATITYDSDPSADGYLPNHLHLTGVALNLDQNSGKDKVKVAYSIMNKSVTDNTQPTSASIIIEFASADTQQDVAKEYARFKIYQDSPNFSSNRYFIAESALEDLEYSDGFSWNIVNIVKVYVSMPAPNVTVSDKEVTSGVATLTLNSSHQFGVGGQIQVTGVDNDFDGFHTITAIDTSSVSFNLDIDDVASTSSSGIVNGYSSTFYVALDALRFENTTDVNPLYGMTGYTVIKNENTNGDSVPFIKEPNTASLVEFRFEMDVQ